MVETITVPGAPFVLDEARSAAVQRALQLLHLIAGVSYYKAGVPDTVSIDSSASMPIPPRWWRPFTSTAWANSPTATA